MVIEPKTVELDHERLTLEVIEKINERSGLDTDKTELKDGMYGIIDEVVYCTMLVLIENYDMGEGREATNEGDMK